MNCLASYGVHRAVKGGETDAESRSTDLGYVLRTLPPDLRKHWESLPEIKQREIIDKALASAGRKDSGEMTDASSLEKNLIRRYSNAPKSAKSRSLQEPYDQDEIQTDETQNGKEDHGIRKDVQETSMYDAEPHVVRVDVQRLRAETPEIRTEDTEIRSEEQVLRINGQGSERETGNQPNKKNAERILVESGYKSRLAEKRIRVRTGQNVEDKAAGSKEEQSHVGNEPEIRIAVYDGRGEARRKERSHTKEVRSAIGHSSRNMEKRSENGENLHAAGKEYGRKESLKRITKAAEQRRERRFSGEDLEAETGLRTAGRELEDETGLRTAGRELEDETGLRIEEPELEDRSGLRSNGWKEKNSPDQEVRNQEGKDRSGLRTTVRENGSQLSLQKTGNEKTGHSALRTSNRKEEKTAGLKTGDQGKSGSLDLRTVDQKPENISGLRTTENGFETGSGELRTLQTDRFQKTASKMAPGKNSHTGQAHKADVG